eukprot:663620-Ditylum_brightwellii.AAC.1
MKVELTTLDASVVPEYKVHPDDAVLDNEPTLFEEMLNANVEEDSDSDNDSDDDIKEKGIRELSTADKKKQNLHASRKKAAATTGNESDSDDDAEVKEVYMDK